MEDINPIAFYSATILEWKHLLKNDKYKQIIIDSLKFCVTENRVKIFGFVLMPNHIHLLWSMIPGMKQEDVQRNFMKFTAQQMKFDLQKNDTEYLQKFKVAAVDREYQIWERLPRSFECYSCEMVSQKLNYIHNNPCHEKWKLADVPENYKYSSAKFYLSGADDWGFLTNYADYYD